MLEMAGLAPDHSRCVHAGVAVFYLPRSGG
jgi:hypothetical protein